MIMISVIAICAYSAVLFRCLAFTRSGHRQRRDDRAEVARMATSVVIILLSMISLWVVEPWKLESNSMVSSLFMAHTIFVSAYFYHRIDTMERGRDRREGDRRSTSYPGARA